MGRSSTHFSDRQMQIPIVNVLHKKMPSQDEDEIKPAATSVAINPPYS